MTNDSNVANKIVLIDGVCNLCVGLVQFIIRNEKNQEIKFASIQDPIGAKLLKEHGLVENDLSSVILIKDQQLYRFSDAALEIAKELKSPWSWLANLKFIPVSLRDFCYRLIAKNRYRLFGERASCFVPTPELNQRFLK